MIVANNKGGATYEYGKSRMESGISHSTLKNIMHETVTDNLLSTTILLASGFGMTVSEFLDSPLFDEQNLNI